MTTGESPRHTKNAPPARRAIPVREERNSMEEVRTGAVATTESVFGGQNGQAQEPAASMPEPANVFGFAPEDAAEAAAPQETDQQAGPEDPGANTGEDAGDAVPAPRNKRRNAFAEQRRALEERHRNDPATLIGERILKDRMQRDGTDRRAAYESVMQRLNDAEDKAAAQAADVSPGMARYMREMRETMQGLQDRLGMSGQPEGPREAEEPAAGAEERAREIVDELLQTPVPRGFDMDSAINDPGFVELLAEFTPAAAVRIYQAEHMAPQQVADRLRARQGVPASTRPQQAVRPEPNYREMSSEDFFKMKERVAKSIY